MKTQVREEINQIKEKVRVYLSVNRFDAAEKLLKATLVDYGPMANIHNLLGVTYHKQSKFIEALDEFKKSYTTNPNFIEALLNLAVTLCDLSRYDEAREIFARVWQQIKSPKRQPTLVLGRIANLHAKNGRAYEENHMFTEAIQEYKKALALFQKMPDVKLRLAKLFLKTGQIERSKEELEDILKVNPDDVKGLTWLGLILLKQGHVQEAREFWRKVLIKEPNDEVVLAYLKISENISITS